MTRLPLFIFAQEHGLKLANDTSALKRTTIHDGGEYGPVGFRARRRRVYAYINRPGTVWSEFDLAGVTKPVDDQEIQP